MERLSESENLSLIRVNQDHADVPVSCINSIGTSFDAAIVVNHLAA
jgi:hypothetical protein